MKNTFLQGTNLKVLLIFLFLVAGEYATNYFQNLPFTYDHLTKYAVAYPLYQILFAIGSLTQSLVQMKAQVDKMEQEVFTINENHAKLVTDFHTLKEAAS